MSGDQFDEFVSVGRDVCIAAKLNVSVVARCWCANELLVEIHRSRDQMRAQFHHVDVRITKYFCSTIEVFVIRMMHFNNDCRHDVPS